MRTGRQERMSCGKLQEEEEGTQRWWNGSQRREHSGARPSCGVDVANCSSAVPEQVSTPSTGECGDSHSTFRTEGPRDTLL